MYKCIRKKNRILKETTVNREYKNARIWVKFYNKFPLSWVEDKYFPRKYGKYGPKKPKGKKPWRKKC